jgi:hypothetical protein
VRRHTTQSVAAYEPPNTDKRLWWFIVAGLSALALVTPLLRSVCTPDAAMAAFETAAGVRHEQRGTVWYHCEPWIVRALR